MKHIKLVQLDGKLPNLALMRLAHWHRSQGNRVRLTRSVQPTLFDQEGTDVVYGSAIFTRSVPKVRELQAVHPQAIVGGTGSGEDLALTVEQVLGVEEYERHDYSIYPEYPWPEFHPAGMPAQLRVLRSSSEGGKTEVGQHHSGHLETGNPAEHRTAGQRFLRAG